MVAIRCAKKYTRCVVEKRGRHCEHIRNHSHLSTNQKFLFNRSSLYIPVCSSALEVSSQPVKNLTRGSSR